MSKEEDFFNGTVTECKDKIKEEEIEETGQISGLPADEGREEPEPKEETVVPETKKEDYINKYTLNMNIGKFSNVIIDVKNLSTDSQLEIQSVVERLTKAVNLLGNKEV